MFLRGANLVWGLQPQSIDPKINTKKKKTNMKNKPIVTVQKTCTMDQ